MYNFIGLLKRNCYRKQKELNQEQKRWAQWDGTYNKTRLSIARAYHIFLIKCPQNLFTFVKFGLVDPASISLLFIAIITTAYCTSNKEGFIIRFMVTSSPLISAIWDGDNYFPLHRCFISLESLIIK